jgi:hypothetical protein
VSGIWRLPVKDRGKAHQVELVAAIALSATVCDAVAVRTEISGPERDRGHAQSFLHGIANWRGSLMQLRTATIAFTAQLLQVKTKHPACSIFGSSTRQSTSSRSESAGGIPRQLSRGLFSLFELAGMK